MIGIGAFMTTTAPWLRKRGYVAQIPANALTLGGQPLTLGGQIITLG